MNPFFAIDREEVRIEKANGMVLDTCMARFSKDIIYIDDVKIDIQEGDVIVRKLPNGKGERSRAAKVTFLQTRDVFWPAHYQVEFINEDTYKMQQKTSPNVIIHNAGAVQIGDHNTQNIINAIQDLQNKIDASAATPEEKAEAKGWLAKALSHPVITSILGGLSGGLVG
jgi:hypothetical protein